MQMIPVRDGAKLSTEISGDGATIVLISGLGGLASFWDPVIDAMGSAFTTIRFDQRGIGKSERGSEAISIQTLAQDTWDVLDALEVTRPILCGHSTGGAIAQEMALKRTNAASGLILNGTWAGSNWFMDTLFGVRLDLLARSPEKYAAISALVGSPPRWLNEHSEVLKRATENPPNDDLATVTRDRIHALLAHDCRTTLPTLNVPALILGAEDDQIVPAYLQEELASLVPNAALNVFPTGGHFFPVTRTDATVGTMMDWMQKSIASH